MGGGRNSCDCLEDCEHSSFSPSLSAGQLSKFILTYFNEDEDVIDRYRNALEIRNRVNDQEFFQLFSLLSNISKSHSAIYALIHAEDVTQHSTSIQKLVALSLRNLLDIATEDLKDGGLKFVAEHFVCDNRFANDTARGVSTRIEECIRYFSMVAELLSNNLEDFSSSQYSLLNSTFEQIQLLRQTAWWYPSADQACI